MPGKDIVVIGASAGGVEALREIVAALPDDYGGSVFVVLHMSPDAPTLLHQILERAGHLPVELARNGTQNGTKIKPGRIVVGRPDYHLVLEPGKVRAIKGPRENRHRPSIDVLFRSAARYYGPRVIAVLLSGMRNDGVSGLHAIKRMGGTVIIQEPEDANYPELPASGIALDHPDRVLAAADIARELVRLSREAPGKELPLPMDVEKEVRYAQNQTGPQETPSGSTSEFACPDCHGTMWEIKEGDLVRYRCRVGHSFTEDTLVTSKEEQLENALWAALRALEESAAIEKRAAERAGNEQHSRTAARLRDSAETKIEHARLIRDVLLRATSSEMQVTGTD